MSVPANRHEAAQRQLRKSNPRLSVVGKPSGIRTPFGECLTTLRRAYERTVEQHLELLFSRVHSGEFGRDLGEVGEVYKMHENGNDPAPSSDTMGSLADALTMLKYDKGEADITCYLVLACATPAYRKGAPGGGADETDWSFCLARDIRDAYLKRLAQVSLSDLPAKEVR